MYMIKKEKDITYKVVIINLFKLQTIGKMLVGILSELRLIVKVAGN